jgi:hypothetical protein
VIINFAAKVYVLRPDLGSLVNPLQATKQALQFATVLLVMDDVNCAWQDIESLKDVMYLK